MAALQLRKCLAKQRRRKFAFRQVCLIQVLSRDEITPAISGRVLMLDAASDGEEDLRNMRSEITRSAVKAYEEAFDYHHKEIADFCAARGVGFVTVCSDESIEQMLFQKATEIGLIQ